MAEDDQKFPDSQKGPDDVHVAAVAAAAATETIIIKPRAWRKLNVTLKQKKRKKTRRNQISGHIKQ